MTERSSRRWQVLALLAAAFLMTVLDGTILFAALPSIDTGLGATGAAVQWTVTVYTVAFSGLLLFFGRAADRLGRKRLFLGGMVIRVVGSLLCGLAPTIEVLVAARALQGISAAIIAPAALSLLMSTFPDGPERNKALGIWGGLGGTGATAGLLLGGVLTDALGWHWVFLINVPVGLVVLALAPGLLAETRDLARPPSFGLASAVSVTAALVLLVYVIIELPVAGWSAPTFGALGCAVVFGALFRLAESRSVAPLAPPRLFRSRTVVGGNLLILLAGMAVDCMLITLTGHVQQVLGWSAVQFGLVAGVMTVASVVGGLVSQHAATRHGTRLVAAVGGALITGSSLALTQVSADGSVVLLLIAQLFFGFGLGGVFVCAQITALTGVEERDSGVAAGLVDTSFSIGNGLGLATGSSVAAAVVAGMSGLTGVTGEPTRLALAHGQHVAWGVAGGFALLALTVAVTLLPGRRAATPPPATPDERADATPPVPTDPTPPVAPEVTVKCGSRA